MWISEKRLACKSQDKGTMIHSANSITCIEINRDNVLLFNSLSLNSQFDDIKKTFPHDCEKALCVKYNLSSLKVVTLKNF